MIKEHTNCEDLSEIEEHRTKEATDNKRKPKEREQDVRYKSTKGKGQTTNEQQQEEKGKTLHHSDKMKHCKRTKNNEDTKESNDTDSSVYIDEHRTKKAAEQRNKKATEHDKISGSTTVATNKLPRTYQPYVWGDKDDSTKDE